MNSKNILFLALVALFVVYLMLYTRLVYMNNRQQEHDKFVSRGVMVNRDSCLVFLGREINDVVVSTYKVKTRLYVKLKHTHPYRLYGVWAPGFKVSEGDSLIKKSGSFEIQVAYKSHKYENRKIYHPQDEFDCSYWDELIQLGN